MADRCGKRLEMVFENKASSHWQLAISQTKTLGDGL